MKRVGYRVSGEVVEDKIFAPSSSLSEQVRASLDKALYEDWQKEFYKVLAADLVAQKPLVE